MKSNMSLQAISKLMITPKQSFHLPNSRPSPCTPPIIAPTAKAPASHDPQKPLANVPSALPTPRTKPLTSSPRCTQLDRQRKMFLQVDKVGERLANSTRPK